MAVASAEADVVIRRTRVGEGRTFDVGPTPVDQSVVPCRAAGGQEEEEQDGPERWRAHFETMSTSGVEKEGFRFSGYVWCVAAREFHSARRCAVASND